jgi:tetratricopeptide (TPR) repeat protein
MEMTQIEDLHRKAMESADLAVIARRRGDSTAAMNFFHQAFERERAAAELVASDLSLEPTRSVLHRSAAALALESGEYSEASRLISAALDGNPPPKILEELNRLRKQLTVKAPEFAFEAPVAGATGVERLEVVA